MLRYVRPVFAPVWRASTYRHLVYVMIGGLLGLGYLLVLAVGAALGVAGGGVLGVLVLIVLSGFSRTLRDIERELANTMLGTDVPAPMDRPPPVGGPWRRLRAALENPVAWRAVLWLGLRVSLGLFALLQVGSSAGVVGMGLFDIMGLLDVAASGAMLGYLVWAVPLGVAMVLAILHFVNLLAWVYRRLAMPLLGPSQAERLAALERRNEELAFRTRLARELHDSVGHTMTVAVLQAAAARKVFDDDPRFALKALATI